MSPVVFFSGEIDRFQKLVALANQWLADSAMQQALEARLSGRRELSFSRRRIFANVSHHAES